MKTSAVRLAAASAAHWVAGAAWYGALASPFAQLIGPDKLRELESRNEGVAFGLAFAASVAVVLVLDWILRAMRAYGGGGASATRAGAAVIIAAAATQLPTTLFEGRSLGLFILSIGYQAIGITAATVVLTARRPGEAEHGERRGENNCVERAST